MSDQETERKQGNTRHGGIAESEMDRQRMGAGLGDTLDGKNVADMGRRAAEPPGVGSSREPVGTQPDLNLRSDAGGVEDAVPGEGDADEIESQDVTSSGRSGL